MGADEEKIARITSWSLGLLAFFVLGLTILDISNDSPCADGLSRAADPLVTPS
jgi:hypothetical protein